MTQPLEKSASLAGHVALVTGGATGIGRAMAEAMAKAGAKVWIASRNDGAINLAVAEMRAVDCSVHGARLDVTDRAQVQSVVSSIVEEDKKIDILFNGGQLRLRRFQGNPTATRRPIRLVQAPPRVSRQALA
jgi:NAD(P)-dependent dehydrogenase (short-subunit alcohol dehydrogenase family)